MNERRTVVWDLGGVLLRWDPIVLIADALAVHPQTPIRSGSSPSETAASETAASETAASETAASETVRALVSTVFQDFTPDSDWSAFDRGVLDARTLRDRICARTGLGSAFVEAMLDGIPSHLEYLSRTEELIDRVCAAGHRSVFLSNMPVPYADWLESEPRFTGRFSAGVFSCRVHRVKPEPELYQVAEKELGLAEGPVLMIDDRLVNLIPARDQGWAGVHFRNVDQCAAELEQFGWL